MPALRPVAVEAATPPPAPEPVPERSPVTPAGPAPTVPAANTDGSFSLARQLGLGISRIVIDAGHGGHDPGTLTSGTNEARLVLDVALRLEKLLVRDGFDVVLTRRTDVFIPLEQRTAIANREGADLFLSIHANASRDPKARGIEVYYLSFASNPEAEAVAARENATSAGGMHNLPSIVRAIALNNKLDESRDLAAMVQQSLTARLSKTNVGMRNRGVKKAPFVVLIGAQMPSILAEIGFITNRQEVALIKTPAYRQKIAESLQAAVVQYQRSLKRQTSVATR
ncbi:MAG: N-acetylmuramoyl-L-alanine amidase [Acidobacteria bacterium]|nr:N-acetylmuramoyl-L-alanine amidase [Acidobacteriota bacterium]